jgi:long-chain acyl-CoA synthetase
LIVDETKIIVVIERHEAMRRGIEGTYSVEDNRLIMTLDPDELETFARERGLGDAKEAAQSEQVRTEVDQAVDDANRAVSRAESIRKTAILERDFTIEDGELTPTLKVRRMVVADHFAGAIDDLYAG